MITSVERFGTAGVGARQPFTDPGPLPPQAEDEVAAKRRRTQIQIGVAFLATALLLPLGTYKYATRNRVEVLTLSKDLEAGEQIDSSKLSTVMIPQSAAADTFDNPLKVIDERVKTTMRAGSILKTYELGAPAVVIGPGQTAFTVDVPAWVWKNNGGMYEIGTQLEILRKGHAPKNGKGKGTPETQIAVVILKNWAPPTVAKGTHEQVSRIELVAQIKFEAPIREALKTPGQIIIRAVAK